MSTKRKTQRKMLKQEMVSHHLRLPKPLDDWLNDYALREGFTSVPELVREVTRSFKEDKETAMYQREQAA